MKPNEISHYNSLQKQDTANRKLIRKLQLEKEELIKQLNILDVVCKSKCNCTPKTLTKKYTSCYKCGKILQVKP